MAQTPAHAERPILMVTTPSTTSLPSLAVAPERIFLSVDSSTGRATISFAPADVGAPITVENDPQGESVLRTAQAIVARYPSCVITGPHFFESAKGRPKRRGRPPDSKGTR
jgi:hypothetical protein